MWTLLWVVVCFLVLSVGVAALARSTTSRWERERARRRRPPAPPPEPAPAPGGVAGRVQVLRRAAGHGLASARRRGGRAVPQVTAVLRRVHLEHRHPAQLAARVVHRRGRRSRAADELSGPGSGLPVGEEGEHALEEERGRPGVVGGQ
jgi:hypothetical protein